MFWWLVAVALCVLIWGGLWRTNLALAFGILIGLLGAWFVSRLMTPYVTGLEEIPLWLPPLPMATVAVILFTYGAIVWIQGNKRLRQPKQDTDNHRY